jgi:putative ABC transport system permease protein
MKEVGMRKIMGAKPRQLMAQFFTEVLMLTALALVLAIIFYQIVLPFYNNLSGKSLSEWQIFEKENLLVIGSMLLFVVIVSGLYPAFFIARFRAGSFLKDDKLPNSMPNRVRSGLVVFQFIVSVSLISASILVQQQMDLMKNKDLGFDKDQVVNVKLYGLLWWKAFSETSVVKNELLRDPNILAVGRVGSVIGDNLSVEGVVPEGKEQEEDKFRSVRVIRIDEDYLDVMNIQLVAGRNFSTEFNDSSAFILNESAVKMLGLTNPVGQRLNNMTMNRMGSVVGVVKDYHFASLHNTIEPLVLEYKPEWTGLLTVKLRAGKTAESLAHIKKTVDTLAPGTLFAYEFLDEHLNMLYKSEDSMGKVFQFFSLLAIIIACMGLLGLSAYTVESRTKEIGIRKVLGATVSGIVAMISSQFFRLVAVAFFVAVPLTWYAMHQWLQNFAYQTDIQWWVFAATGAIVFVIALGVVSFHTITAATRNPVRSLRYE